MKKIVLIGAAALSMFSLNSTASQQCGIGKTWNEFAEACVEECQFGYKWNNYTQSCIEDDMEEQEDGCEDDDES